MTSLIATKLIRSGSKRFIFRASLRQRIGSYKLHVIMNDDTGEPHSHPWDFSSLIIFGGYTEILEDGSKKRFGMFSVNRKDRRVKHLIRLHRVCGFKIPAITIGWYGPKLELCSLCKELGYCKSNVRTA